MARVTYTATERGAAVTGKSVLFAFGIDAENCPDCPDRLLLFSGHLPKEQAETLIAAVRDTLKSFKTGVKP